MTIWKQTMELSLLNRSMNENLAGLMGIVITEVGPDFMRGTMPVDKRNHQPMGILHGGASCVLAETLGSIASNACLDPAISYAVGLNIEASHVRAITSGLVVGTARPLHLGRSTHVWDIELRDEQGKLVCSSKLTTMIKNKN